MLYEPHFDVADQEQFGRSILQHRNTSNGNLAQFKRKGDGMVSSLTCFSDLMT